MGKVVIELETWQESWDIGNKCQSEKDKNIFPMSDNKTIKKSQYQTSAKYGGLINTNMLSPQ